MGKRVTIYDIAEALEISTGTVYRALNNKPRVSEQTRLAVLSKAKDMGFVPNTLARSLSRQTIRLAVVAYSNFRAFHGEMIRGAREAQEALRDYNIHVDYFQAEGDVYYMPDYDASLDSTLLQVLRGDYDGVLICAKQRPGLAMLKECGVMVATVISDVEPELRNFSVRYNGYAAGRMAAELIYRGADRRRPVVIASGYLGGKGIHHEILNGFQAQMERMPLNLARVYYHHDNPEEAYDLTRQLLTEIPDLGAVYVDSFNSDSVIRALLDAKRSDSVFLVTSDIYDELREYINRGIVAASIFQNQSQSGFRGLNLLYQAIADGVQVPDTTFVKPEIILQGNLDLY